MGIKNWLGNVLDESHIKHNMKILCQGREDNPVHEKAFNVLIEKNPIWSRNTLYCEHSITRTLFMEENSDGDRIN